MKWLTALKNAEKNIPAIKTAIHDIEETAKHAVTEELQKAKALKETVKHSVTEEVQKAKALEEAVKHSVTEEVQKAKALEEAVKHSVTEEVQKSETFISTKVDAIEETLGNTEKQIQESQEAPKSAALSQVENKLKQKISQTKDKIKNAEKNIESQAKISIKQSIKKAESTLKTQIDDNVKNELKKILPKPGRINHLFSLAIINILIYLSYHGILTNWLRIAGASAHVDKVNYAYLADAKHYTLDLLVILSESKMLLSLLKSSQGGINFIVDIQIQLGQILNTLDSAIDYAWKLSIAALSSVELLSMTMEIGKFSMTPILTTFLIFLGLGIALKSRALKLASILSNASYFLAFIVLLTHFLIPWSIYATASLSQYVFAHHKGEVHRGYSALHQDLPKHDEKSGLKDQVKGSMLHFKNNQHKMHKHTSNVTGLTAKHMMISFVEYALMPLLFLFSLSLIAKRGLALIKPDMNTKLAEIMKEAQGIRARKEIDMP